MTHECGKCGQSKPVSEFYRSSKYSRGHGKNCKQCVLAGIHAWRAQNPEAARHSKRRRDYRTKYGITIADYEAIYAAQHGCCAICDKALDKNPVGAKHTTHIDHDHTTGEVRGLLCATAQPAT
jgi:hypothetical protein